MFVGDSITHGGHYVEYLETLLRLHRPEGRFDFLNLGLPSETLSGLSEPGHAGGAFPRPDLHERLGRLLAKTHPTLLVACYGMNDGIYHPYSEERFNAFRSGLERLRTAAGAAGARVIHLTPPVFDPVPIRSQTLPAGLAEYRSPFVGYNEVLDRYSLWLLEQRRHGWEVIDIHGPMNRRLELARKSDPSFRLAGDGVHINEEGHWIMTQGILRHLGLGDLAEGTSFSTGPAARNPKAAPLLALVEKRQRILKDAWLNEVGHKRPGMGKGRPLPEAEASAREFDQQARALLGAPAATR